MSEAPPTNTKNNNEVTPLASHQPIVTGAICDEHLLLNTNLKEEELYKTTPNRKQSKTNPTSLYNNNNSDYVARVLTEEEEIRNCMPLTYSLANVRGSWESLIGNVTIKERKQQQQQLNNSGNSNNESQENKTNDLSSSSRCPADSFIQLRLAFTTNPALFSRYRLFETDRIRVGKLIEDLDALAADIAYKHIGPHSIDNYTVVTGGMDRISMRSPVSRQTDILIYGSVTIVGTTSMEVRLLIETLSPTGEKFLLSQANFAMVSRHKKLYTAAKVPLLIPITDYDKFVYEAGIVKREKRKELTAKDLKHAAPTPEEIELIHKLYLEKSKQNTNNNTNNSPAIIPQSKTTISTVEVMHHQERNVHNKIFGGHLMKLAFELASICAFGVTAVFPILKSMDDVAFYFPVEIGSILTLKATIQYISTERHLVFVIVVAEMMITTHVDRPTRLTNEFHFNFLCMSTKCLPLIVPESYPEIVNYLDGRRREKQYIELDEQQVQK